MKRKVLIPGILRYKLIIIAFAIAIILIYSFFLFEASIIFLVVIICLSCLNPGHRATIVISKGQYKYVPLKNKYLKVTFIDEKGLRAGRNEISWSDISIIVPVTFEYKRLDNGWYGMREVEMLCITKNPSIDWSKDLLDQGVLMIQFSKKTYYTLCKYAKGKSLVVDELLDNKAYKYITS